MQKMNCQVVASLQIGVAKATAGFPINTDGRLRMKPFVVETTPV